MKDAPRFVVEDAVEILVAGAMRLGVLDDHVMIGQLLAAREVKAVEDALQPFARELGANVRSREFCAERKRMDDDVARAAELRRDRGDVKRMLAFVLKLHVLNDGVRRRRPIR